MNVPEHHLERPCRVRGGLVQHAAEVEVRAGGEDDVGVAKDAESRLGECLPVVGRDGEACATGVGRVGECVLVVALVVHPQAAGVDAVGADVAQELLPRLFGLDCRVQVGV